MDLEDRYIMSNAIEIEYTFFPQEPMYPSLKSDSILDHKSSLTYYRRIEIIFSTPSYHGGIKLEWTFTNHWRNQVLPKPALCEAQVPRSWSQTVRSQRSWRSQTSSRCFSNWRFTWTSKDCWTTQQSKIINLIVIRKYHNFCYSSSNEISFFLKKKKEAR